MVDPWVIASFLVKAGLLISLLHFAGETLVRIHPGVALGRKLMWGTMSLVFMALVLPVRAAALTGTAGGLMDTALIGALWSTPVGSAVLIGLVGLGIAALGSLLHPVLAGCGALIALFSLGVSGHVASQTDWLLQVALALHLAVGAWWIGILGPLARLADTQPAVAADVGHRFGRAAAWLVPVMLLAGGAIATALTGGPLGLIATPYGQLLLVKIGVVCALLALAAANKLRHVPALRRGEAAAAARLARSARTERAAVLLILLLTAALTTFVGPA